LVNIALLLKTGEFRNDLFNGKGIYYFADGERLVGDFKDGQHVPAN